MTGAFAVAGFGERVSAGFFVAVSTVTILSGDGQWPMLAESLRHFWMALEERVDGLCLAGQRSRMGRVRNCGSRNSHRSSEREESQFSSSMDFYFDGVLMTVVDEVNRSVGLLLTIDEHADRRCSFSVGSFDGDMVKGITVAVVDLERLPGSRQPRVQPQCVHFQLQTKQRLDDEPVHPTGRARIPSPAASAGVRCDRIDVGGNHVRLD